MSIVLLDQQIGNCDDDNDEDDDDGDDYYD